MAEVADMKTRDVAGELFTKTYRDAKIVGKLTEKANYETGSCFDMTVSNLDRAGAHHLKMHGDIPKWSGETLKGLQLGAPEPFTLLCHFVPR